jgi:hypothetical protein
LKGEQAHDEPAREVRERHSEVRAAIRPTPVAELILKTVDESTRGTTGVSLMHILTFGSIGASIALYLAGKRQAGIFVGLWPPTFQALKSVVDKNTKRG